MKSVFYMRCAKICGISIRNTSSMFLHLSSFLTMYVNIIGRFTKTEKLKLNRDFTENLISNKEIRKYSRTVSSHICMKNGILHPVSLIFPNGCFHTFLFSQLYETLIDVLLMSQSIGAVNAIPFQLVRLPF